MGNNIFLLLLNFLMKHAGLSKYKRKSGFGKISDYIIKSVYVIAAAA